MNDIYDTLRKTSVGNKMKGAELADCLSKAKYLQNKMKIMAEDVVTIGPEEGEDYLSGAREYIYKACDMLTQYCVFITEDDDEKDICLAGNTDAEYDNDGMLS